MKKIYKKPQAEWLSFQVEECITVSGGGDNQGGGVITFSDGDTTDAYTTGDYNSGI